MNVDLNENSDESDLSEDEEENDELLEQLIELDEKVKYFLYININYLFKLMNC